MYFNLFFGESFSQQWRSRACIDTILRRGSPVFPGVSPSFSGVFFQFHQLFWESSTFSWCCTRAPSSSGVHQFFLEFFFFFRCWKRNTGFFFSFTRLSGALPVFPVPLKSPSLFWCSPAFLKFFPFYGIFEKSQIFPKFSPFFRCCQSSSFFRCSPAFSGALLFFPVFLLDPIRFFSEPPWIIRKLSRFSLRCSMLYSRFALTMV